MRIKKGFTLAEILIVLMVIGVIATMTVPGLMAAVQEQQFKTGYKKAYNTIANIMSMEAVGGTLPGSVNRSSSGLTLSTYKQMYKIMATNLSFKGFALDRVESANAINMATMATSITIQGQSGTAQRFGSSTGTPLAVADDTPADASTLWVITEDNMAYAAFVNMTAGGLCGKKTDINGMTANPYTPTNGTGPCSYIIVDVNGLNKTPNRLQGYNSSSAESTASAGGSQYVSGGTLPTPKLTYDRYYIYIGSDGATGGNPNTTLTGRLLADVK